MCLGSSSAAHRESCGLLRRRLLLLPSPRTGVELTARRMRPQHGHSLRPKSVREQPSFSASRAGARSSGNGRRSAGPCGSAPPYPAAARHGGCAPGSCALAHDAVDRILDELDKSSGRLRRSAGARRRGRRCDTRTTMAQSSAPRCRSVGRHQNAKWAAPRTICRRRNSST